MECYQCFGSIHSHSYALICFSLKPRLGNLPKAVRIAATKANVSSTQQSEMTALIATRAQVATFLCGYRIGIKFNMEVAPRSELLWGNKELLGSLKMVLVTKAGIQLWGILGFVPFSQWVAAGVRERREEIRSVDKARTQVLQSTCQQGFPIRTYLRCGGADSLFHM